MLILAGISINAILGNNGIIKKAREEERNALEKKVQDEIKRTVTEYDIVNKGETLEEYLKNNIPEKVDEVTRKDDKTLEVKKEGVTVEVESEIREFKVGVEPYVGTYDGKSHNALSSVNVTPSEATIEYSTDGKNFSGNMPTMVNASSISVTVRVSRTGYKTKTVTVIAKVNKAEGKINLSATSGTLTYPTNGTFTVSNNTGSLSAVSNNTNIATVSVSGNIVTIKPGTTAGKATITVTSAEASNYKAKSATYEATVNNGTIRLSATPYTGTYDGKAHNALTNVSVNPSDAKLEYSINGGTYSTTMPTVTNSSSFTVTVRASKAGYKTQSTTQTVKVNKATGTLRLSATSGTITYPNSGTFTVSGNTGTISVTSSNAKVATVSIKGNTVTIKSVGAGTATITVKSASNTNYNEKTATYTVTVQYPTFTGNSGVGYYADVDGNGTPDGIIFVDLKNGAKGSWALDGEYNFATVSGTKNYKVSQQNYNGKFGTKDVLVANGSGNNRFYVMALSDYKNGNKFTYYLAKVTLGEWSTPTKELWAAFASQLGIRSSNYASKGLQNEYWSSTGVADNYAYYPAFHSNVIGYISLVNCYAEKPIRLTRTF